MPPAAYLTPLDPTYPSRLRVCEDRPASITVRGDPVEAARTIAIVGSRDATSEAREFAGALASTLAREGIVVVSGGAHGIDAAAHEGALAVGGRTWAVAGTGERHCYPSVHANLFETIARGPGAMLWPFPPDHHHRSAFLLRNRVLVALADVVVVVQAGLGSGALHAASCARRLHRPLWVVPAAPWMGQFGGSRQLLEEGAIALTSVGKLLGSLGLTGESSASRASEVPSVELRQLSASESNVLRTLSSEPIHVDAIAAKSCQGVPATSAALLTLALEDVVVEGPPGFFRRRDSRKH